MSTSLLPRRLVFLLCLLALAGVSYAALWVALPESRGVVCLDVDGGETLAEFDFEAPPSRLALSPDGRRLYVACHENGQTHVVNPATGGLIRRMPYVVPVFAAGDSSHYYAPALGGVFRYEVGGYRTWQLAFLPDTSFSYDYALTPDGRWFVYVQRYQPRPGRELAEPPIFKRIAVCDLENESGTYLALESPPRRVAVSPTGRHGAVAMEDGLVGLFSLEASPVVLAAQRLAADAFYLAFTADGGVLHCVTPDGVWSLDVPELDSAPRQTVFDVEGSVLVAAAFDPSSGTLYVADSQGGIWSRSPGSVEFNRLTALSEAPSYLIFAPTQ